MSLNGAGDHVTKHMENAKIICGFTPVSFGEDCSQASQVPKPSGRFYGSVMAETSTVQPVVDLDAEVYLSTDEN